MPRITEVVKHLLIINVLMFLGSNVFGTRSLSLYYYQSDLFQPYQIVTHFFMHADLTHIFFNMFALVMFGTVLETIWGSKKFLFYYIWCAIGAAIIHFLIVHLDFVQMQSTIQAFAENPTSDSFLTFFRSNFDTAQLTAEGAQLYEQLSRDLRLGNEAAIAPAQRLMEELYNVRVNGGGVLGASGAIFGLLLAFGVLFPEHKIFLIFLPIGFKAKYFIPVMMVVELFLGVQNFEFDNIAHFAHLGGAIFGALLLFYWSKNGSNNNLR